MHKLSHLIVISAIVALIGLIGCSQPSASGGGGDVTPPGEVIILSQIEGNGTLSVTWADPDDSDFDEIAITYGVYGGSMTTDTVFPGVKTWTASGLTNDTAYEVILKTVDTIGNDSSGVTLLMTPTTTADDVFPTIISTVPVADAGGIATDTTVAIKFSEAMNTASVTDPDNYTITSNFAGSDPAFDGTPTVTWDTAANTATYDFGAELSPDTEYDCTAGTDITDLAGNTLAGTQLERTMSFTTVAAGAVATPAFSLPEGTYDADLSLEISCSTADSTIYYILSSSTPSDADTEYTGPIAITPVDSPLTISAIAIADSTSSMVAESTFTVVYPQAYKPTIIPASAGFTTDQTIDLEFTSPDEGVSYWYAVDYSDPSKTDIDPMVEYDPLSPPVLSLDIDDQGILVGAEARGAGFETSELNTALYGLSYETAAAPTFSPAGGTIASQTEFSISEDITLSSSTPGAVIYYTTDDSAPDMGSDSVASGESITISADSVLRAIAVADQFKNSDESETAYYDLVPSILGSLALGGASGMDVAVFLVNDDTDFNNPGAWVNATTYDNASGSVDFVVPMPDGDYYLCAAASDNLASFPSDGDYFAYYSAGAATIPSLNSFDQSGSDVADLDFTLMDAFYLVGDYFAYDGMNGEDVQYVSGLLDITMTVDSITDPREVSFSIIAWDDSEQWVILKEEGGSEYEIYGWIPGSPITFISYADSTVMDGASQFATAQEAYDIIGHANEETETWPIYSDVDDIPKATTPAFDPPSGTVFVGAGPHNITIGSSDGEYMIFTTTDGSDPTLASNTFPSGNFYEVADVDGITETTTIHAARAGLSERLSDVVSATYTVYDYSLTGTIDVPAGAGGDTVYLYIDTDNDFSNGNETAYNLGVMSSGNDQPFTIYYNSGDFPEIGYFIWAASAGDSGNLPENGEYFGTYSTFYPDPTMVALTDSITDVEISLQEAIDSGMLGTWYTATPDGEFTSTWELLDIANQGAGFDGSDESSLDIIAWDNAAGWVIVKDSDPTNTDPFEIWGWTGATPTTVDIVINGSGYTSAALAYTDLGSLDYGNPTFRVYSTLAAVPKADTPTFSIESGVVAEGVSLTISSSAGSTIYFTVTNEGDVATDPSFTALGMQNMATGSSILITEDVEIRAVAFGPDKRMSDIATASYDVAVNSVSGTLTLPGGSTDVTIFLDDNDDFRDGWVADYTITDAPDGEAYTLYTSEDSGTWYVCAATWDDQVTGPDTADMFGVYSTSVTGVGTKLNLASLNQTGIDISLQAGPDNMGTWYGNYAGTIVTMNIGLLDFVVGFDEPVAGADDMAGSHIAWDNTGMWQAWKDDSSSSDYNKWGWANLGTTQFDLVLYDSSVDVDWSDPEVIASLNESNVLMTVYSSRGLIPDANDAGYPGGGTLSLTIDYSTMGMASIVDNLMILLLNEDDLTNMMSENSGAPSFRASDSLDVSASPASYSFVNCDPAESYFVMVMANSGQLELGSGYGAESFEPPTGYTVGTGSTVPATVDVFGETSGNYDGLDAVTLTGEVDITAMTSAGDYDFMEIDLWNDSGDDLTYVIVDITDLSGSPDYTFTNLNPGETWYLSYMLADFDWDDEYRSNSNEIDISSGTYNIEVREANDGGHTAGGEVSLSGSVDLGNITSTDGIEFIRVSLNDYNAGTNLEYTIDYLDGAPYEFNFINLDPLGDWSIYLEASDDDWNDYGWLNSGIGDGAAVTALDNSTFTLNPPSFDGGYTGGDAATLSGTVDSSGVSGTVDHIEVTLDDGAGTILTDSFWLEWESPTYEFTWLEPGTWEISAIAYDDSWTPLTPAISTVSITVSGPGENTEDLIF